MSLDKIAVECVLSKESIPVEVPKNVRIADVIKGLELPLGFSCGGRGACVACIVYTQGHFSAVSKREQRLLLDIEPEDDLWVPRIACLTRIQGTSKVRATYW